MAFLKSKTLPNGVTGEYWRITNVVLSKTGSTVKVYCKLSLYVSAATKDAHPVDSAGLTINFDTTMQAAVGNLIELCYQKISEKNFPDLEGAQAV